MNDKIVNIYTSAKAKDNCNIISHDTWFDNVRTDRTFLERHKAVLLQIDGAEIIDYKNLTMVTPFGTTDITKLSTGCKTVLNILYLLETTHETMLVNVTESGDKVLNSIFEIVAGTNINLYLSRVVCPDSFDLVYKINDKMIEDDVDFIDSLNFEYEE